MSSRLIRHTYLHERYSLNWQGHLKLEITLLAIKTEILSKFLDAKYIRETMLKEKHYGLE